VICLEYVEIFHLSRSKGVAEVGAHNLTVSTDERMGRDVPLHFDSWLGLGKPYHFCVDISNRVHLLSDSFRGLGRIFSKFVVDISHRELHRLEPLDDGGGPDEGSLWSP